MNKGKYKLCQKLHLAALAAGILLIFHKKWVHLSGNNLASAVFATYCGVNFLEVMNISLEASDCGKLEFPIVGTARFSVG
jgi:hypothetical protein